MKRRDHIATVSFLLGAAVFLLMGNAATAQEFMPPPAFYGGTPSLVYGRFYVQGGVQYRNIQRFGFRKFVRPYSYVQSWGVAPFAGDVQGPFGTGTGVAGYPINPTGDYTIVGTTAVLNWPPSLTADPNVSGVWIYDGGAYIRPEGTYWNLNAADEVTPYFQLWSGTNVGLGQKPGVMSDGTAHYQFDGIFLVANTPDNVQNGFSISSTANALNFTDTTKVAFRRTLDASVNGYGNGVESFIWTTMGSEIRDKEFSPTPVSPTLEVGFQWTDFFDLFGGFSWYDMDINFGRTYDTTSSLSRRGVKDTFPYTSSRTGTWQGTTPSNAYHPSTLIETEAGIWDIILPDSSRNGVSPHREFFFVNDATIAPVPATETITLHTDVRVYEYKLGARSWVPLYGLGRFGIVFGPLLNQIGYNASVGRVTTMQLPQGTVTVPYYESHNGTLLSYGLYAGGDLEVAFGQYYGKFGVNYNISEEKTLKACDNSVTLSNTLTVDPSMAVDTNINLSGFNMAFNLGCRF